MAFTLPIPTGSKTAIDSPGLRLPVSYTPLLLLHWELGTVQEPVPYRIPTNSHTYPPSSMSGL